jgi:NADH-quinone oxidoreductase subunit N
MNTRDITAVMPLLMPLLILAAAPVAIMLVIAVRRSHILTFALSAGAVVAALAAIPLAATLVPRQVSALLIIDAYALFFTGLILLAGLFVLLLSYDYLKRREESREEFYLLLLTALLGAVILTASSHFASFFLGLEVLSVSLYALIAYLRINALCIEAGIKYLILAAFSSAILLFGMALVYSRSGTLTLSGVALAMTAAGSADPALTAGTVLIIVGIGFKLAVVPFHMWAPDIYEGAPAPVAGFVATVSKGAVFAFLLRYFMEPGLAGGSVLAVIFTGIAVLSMFAGNLLALFQDNVKRLLAYSSIAHMGYLLVAFLAAGPHRVMVASFYLAAYFVTTLGAFGIVTVLSSSERDADALEDYRGLFYRRPWIAGIFTAMLLSLAGIPLTAGFIGKFFMIAAGVASSHWLLVASLVITSTIGLFYYLRVIVALYTPAIPSAADIVPIRPLGKITLAVLVVLLLALGVYPGPVTDLISAMTVK